MQKIYSEEFPHKAGLIHLNHAGVGPWPKRTYEAVTKFAHENLYESTKNINKWFYIESKLRKQCQKLIKSDTPDDIALIKNTSEGLSIVAYGVPWKENENVVFAKQEFPSNRIIWQSLESRFGIEARSIDLYAASTPEDAIFQHVDKKTRLVAVSAVQYSDGLRMDLENICAFCKERDILLCIDAIQMLGAMPFDLKKIPADFVIADGHKWLISPEGIGLFYCNPRIRDSLVLNQYGWHMMENMNDYESLVWSTAKNARRFECGSLNNLGIHAMHQSLTLLFEIGIENIYKMISRNISYLYEIFKNKGIKVLSNMELSRRSGIITIQKYDDEITNRDLFQHLIKSNVLCAYRGNGIRFSPHFYTQFDEIDETITRLDSYSHRHS